MGWLLAVLSEWMQEKEKKQKDNSRAEIQTSVLRACPTRCLEFGIHNSYHAENWYNGGFGKHFLCVAEALERAFGGETGDYLWLCIGSLFGNVGISGAF